jgi:hypothetical protein
MHHLTQIGLVAILVLSGCNDRDISSVSERARLESESQVQAENSSRIKRAAEMEEDLVTRQRFYQAVRGVYEGTVQTETGEFQIRLTLIPSLPPYPTRRARTLEEVASDLSNLHFNIQVVQWNPANRLSSVGCRIENVHPDLRNGQIEVASEGCPNVYFLKLSEGGVKDPVKGDAGSIASAVLDGKLDAVPRITGTIQPTTNASVYEFSAVKVQR